MVPLDQENPLIHQVVERRVERLPLPLWSRQPDAMWQHAPGQRSIPAFRAIKRVAAQNTIMSKSHYAQRVGGSLTPQERRLAMFVVNDKEQLHARNVACQRAAFTTLQSSSVVSCALPP